MTLPRVPGQVEVKLTPYIPHGERPRLIGEIIYGHCVDCVQEWLDRFNEQYAIVQTDPVCLLDKETGQLLDLPSGRPS